jgi:GTP pyrophosphokinase
MISFGGCCHPTTGDDIVGYVSRGRGIIVHKRGCKNLVFMRSIENRFTSVEWETVCPNDTRRFMVTARTTYDLFSEIEGAVRKYKGHLIAGTLDTDDSDITTAFFTMELGKDVDFKSVMKCIRSIPCVLNIKSVYDDPA